MRTSLALTLVAFQILTFTALALAESRTPLRVGVVQSLSGIAAEDGSNVVRALQLAAEELNAQGTVKVELLVEDDRSTARDAVTAYRKLGSANVDVVFGATWGFTTNALIPLTARDGIPLINSSVLPESLNLAAGKGYAIGATHSVHEEFQPFRKYLRKEKINSAAFLYVNNTWGQAQLKQARKVAEEEGITIVDELESAHYENNEWNMLIPRLRSKNPDLLVLLLNRSDIETVTRRIGELGVRTKFFTSRHGFHALLNSHQPDNYEGACFSYPYLTLYANPHFREAFYRRFKTMPLAYAGSSYRALKQLVKLYESSSEELPISAQRIEQVLAGTTQAKAASTSMSLYCYTKGELTVSDFLSVEELAR